MKKEQIIEILKEFGKEVLNMAEQPDEKGFINPEKVTQDFADRLSQEPTEGVSEEIYKQMAYFVKSRFPKATAYHHALKLKQEAEELAANPTDPMELADCLLCLFGVSAKAGFTYSELLVFSKNKMQIVEKRKWEEMPDGTFQHIKSQSITKVRIEEVISEVEDMNPYKEAGNPDSYSKYNEGWSDACDVLGEKIKELKQ